MSKFKNGHKYIFYGFVLTPFFLSSISFNLSSMSLSSPSLSSPSCPTLTLSTQSLIETEISKVDKLGKNITDLLEILNKNLSKVVDDIRTNKALDLEVLKSLFKNYPSAKLSELIVLQKDKLSDKLETVLILSGIQAAIFSAISNLKGRTENFIGFDKTDSLIKQLNQKIDFHSQKIHGLVISLQNQLKISASNTISPAENQIMDTLLEKCEYKKILVGLNIKTSAAIAEFKNIVKQTAKSFLTASDLANIQNFLNSSTFNTIKNSPEKLQNILNQASSLLPSSVKTIREKTEDLVKSCS